MLISPATRFGASAVTLALASAAHGQPPSADPSWRPDDIVVTAQRPGDYRATEASVLRTPVPILNTPQSVQVLTRTLLDEQQANTLEDALANVSGVVPSRPSELVLANPIVRGFEAEVFVDGLIAYGDTAVVDPSSLVAVERLEVAKGPTSLLFGGGTGAPVGGLINIVTKMANATPSYAASLRIGSFGTVQPAIDVNRPLADGLAVRLTGEVFTGGDAIDKVRIDRVTLNPSLWARLGVNTELTVRLGYSDIRQLEYAGLPFAVARNPRVDAFRFTSASDAPRTQVENTMVTGVLTHRVSEAASATLQVRRYESWFNEIASFPFISAFPPTGTSYPIIRGTLPVRINEWTVDGSVTAKVATGPVEHVLLIGAQYDATDYDGRIGFGFVPIGAIDYAVPGSDVRFGATVPAPSRFLNEYRTKAVYLQDQMTIAGRVHLLAGLRYTDLGIRELVGGANNTAKGRVDPRLGVSIDLADGVAAFAGWATGSRLTLFYNGGTVPPVPETSRSVEAGVKFALRRAGLSGTIAAYEIKRRNVPTPDPANPFVSVQTGEQRSRGFEADLIWEPVEALSVLASYAFTDARVTRDNSIPLGDELARVPRHSGRLAVRYRLLAGPLKGSGLGAGLTAASSAETTLPNTDRTAGYAVVDVQASYAAGPVSLGLNVTNLFDRRYVKPYQYLGQSVVRPGDPRSIFVTAGVKF